MEIAAIVGVVATAAQVCFLVIGFCRWRVYGRTRARSFSLLPLAAGIAAAGVSLVFPVLELSYRIGLSYMSTCLYERAGSTFVKVSDQDHMAMEYALSKLHLIWKTVFHCPGWFVLDAPINALSSHVHAVAVQRLGGLRMARGRFSLRFMNMDIAIQWVLKGLAGGKTPADVVAEHGHHFDKMMKGDGNLTGHESLEQSAEIIRLIVAIEAAYKQQMNVGSKLPVRKRRKTRAPRKME
jgi:hypothetical protein